MVTHDQVDTYVSAIRAHHVAQSKIYGKSPSDCYISEYVTSLDKLHEIAQALNKSTFELTDYECMEAVDYAGVRFYAVNGKVL